MSDTQRRLLRSLLGALVCSLSLESHAEVLSLRALEKQAIELRGTSHSERAHRMASRAQVSLARTGYMPTASFNAGASLAPGNRVFRPRGSDYYVSGAPALDQGASALAPLPRYTATVSVQSRLYDFGRTSAAIDAAEAGVQASEAEAKSLRAQIVSQVRSAYFEWMVRAAGQTAAERAVVDARERRELVEGFIKDGVRPPADLVPVRRFEASARLEEVKLRGERDAAFDELALAVGGPLPEGAEPDASLLDRTQLKSTALARTDVTTLRRKRDASLATARSHDRWRLPVLSAGAEAGIRGTTDAVFPAYQVGLNVSVPLWDGGSEGARAEIARAEAMDYELQARQAEYTLTAQQASVRRAFQNANERVKVAEELRALAETELQNAEDRYSLGKGSIDDVLDARAALTRADSDLLLARLARAQAALRQEPTQ